MLKYDEEVWQKGKICGFDCEFSDMRIDKKSIPKGKYIYEVSGDDYGGANPVRVAKYILVNFYGTIVTDDLLPLDDQGQLYLKDGDLKIDWR